MPLQLSIFGGMKYVPFLFFLFMEIGLVVFIVMTVLLFCDLYIIVF